MDSAIDEGAPAIFLGGARNGVIETLKYGTENPFRIGDDIYDHILYGKIHVYCVTDLYGTDKNSEFDAAWNELSAETREEIEHRTETYTPAPEPAAPTFPESLFHYTSINNLALILKNKTIRFKRLDLVNDPEEAKAPDLSHANTAVFSSSWTKEDKELLPLWKFYGDDMKGVRIELPINFFKGNLDPTYQDGDRAYQLTDHEITIEREGLDSRKIYHLNGPHEVRYSDDEKEKERLCFTDNGDGHLKLSFFHVGMTKPTCWKFEKEWRYRIFGITPEWIIPPNKDWKSIPRFDLAKHPIEQEYIDIPISKNALNEIKIMLGPLSKGDSSAQRVIVESLLKEFAPGGEVLDSSIEIRPT